MNLRVTQHVMNLCEIRICSLLTLTLLKIVSYHSPLMVSIRSPTNVQGESYSCPSDKILGELSRKKKRCT